MVCDSAHLEKSLKGLRSLCIVRVQDRLLYRRIAVLDPHPEEVKKKGLQIRREVCYQTVQFVPFIIAILSYVHLSRSL